MNNRFIALAAGGLVAVILAAQPVNQEKERQLISVLRSDVPVTDVPIMMEINVVPANAREYKVPVTAKIPGSELALTRNRGYDRTQFDFVAEVKDERGNPVVALRDKLSVPLANSNDAGRTLQYDTSFTLLAGTYTLKFVARDAETGRTGTYQTRFAVPIGGQTAQAGQAARPQEIAQVESQLTPRIQDLVQSGTPVGGRGQVVTGSPVSAREERKTTQTLGDGTVIEHSDSDMFYRDSQGRTRVEQTIDGKAFIIVVDPVAGLRLTIDPASKTVTRVTMIAGGGGRRGGGPVGASGPFISTPFGQVVNSGVLVIEASGVRAEGTDASPASKTEDLGLTNQNGVMAQGTRTTVTIPKGQIGNNREIHVVNERWYAPGIQMVVKTLNSDPRFGVNTYELTNISQNAPDPTLFKEPLGYTVTVQTGGRRGATKN